MPKSIWDPEVQAAFDQVPRHSAGATRREARATAARATARAAAETAETAETPAEPPLPFPSPEDWRDIPIYFLLLDRFNNSTAPPSGTRPWDDPVADVYRGGTFNGVRDRLKYLADLGVRALWLSPVLQNRISDEHAYHGYGIQHFAAINPRFASDYNAALQDPTLAERELRQLIDEAHRRGIYIIFDIVLNHAGDVFAYPGNQSIARWQDSGPYTINWRDENGDPRPDWTDAPADPPLAAAVWPTELRRNDFFRRQGNAFSRPSELQEEAGDFENLKEFVTAASVQDQEGRNHLPVQETLIRAYQYLIAKYDIDGFRIDTLKFIEPSFAHNFGNAIREYALSIGKQNFFTFGEVADSEDKIAQFIGRNTSDPDETVGVDAALDFPLFNTLPRVAKAAQPPSDLIHMFEYRKSVQQHIISSHGEASRYFVTFLDNHDQSARFGYLGPGQPTGFDPQVTIGLACLLTLQGIPCIYYGTEQGLHGQGDRSEAVREALWGKPDAFDPQHPFYLALRDLIAVRNEHPALRYGRQYFRPLSGNGTDFGISFDTQGVLAYSRILNDREVLVVANTNNQQPWSGEVIVDLDLNASVPQLEVYYSNTRLASQLAGVPLIAKQKGSANIAEVNGSHSDGPVRSVRVQLEPMEVQILGRPQA